MSEQPKEKLKHHDFEKVIAYLHSLRRKGFFGTVQLGFQAGSITQIEPKPVLKPGDPLE